MCKLSLIIFFVLAFFLSNILTAQDAIQDKINYYISQAKFDSAQIFIQSNLEGISQKQNASALEYQLVKVLFIQSNYDEALKQAYLSLDEIADKAERVNFDFLIACIYSAIKDYGKSIEYFDLVIQHGKDSTLIVQTHLLSSELHLELQDSVKALQSLTSAYGITRLSKLDPKIKDHVSMQYNFFSQNYELCKQQNLKVIKDSTSFLSAQTYAYSMMGECLIKQDSLLEATKYLHEFLKLTFTSKDPEQIKLAAKKLIEVYEKLGLQEKANAYHKIYNEAESDTLSFSIEKYRDLYNIEKKREMDIAKTNIFRKYLFLGLAFLFLISLVVYNYFKRQNQNKLVVKSSGKKIVISKIELEKISGAVERLVEKELFLTPRITRKSFCIENNIKSERYLSHYINDQYKKSFSVFLNDLRVEYAHKRIQNDSKFRNYRIEEIAKDSGFGSKKSFERAFLAKYDETPYKVILSLSD